MATQHGAAPSGLTGIFDFPHLGATGVNFTIDILLWKVQQDGETRPRAGRGSTGFFKGMRYVATSGGGSTAGLPRGDGWPAPTDWEGAEGTVRIDFNKTKGQYATFPIKVSSFGFKYDKSRDKEFQENIGFVFTDLPTFYGFPGTQPTASSVSKADQTQWANSFKTIDPGKLNSTAQRYIDVWGTLTNSDAAEQTKLEAMISAAVPPISNPHNAKLRSSTFARDAIDGGTITEVWGLTTTDEDAINAATNTAIDANHVTSTATTAEFNGMPAAPTGDSFVLWNYSVKEFNDSMSLYTADYRLLTSLEAITFPETHITVDVSDLTSFGSERKTFTFGQSAPAATDNTASGVQKVSTTITRINEVLSQVDYGYAKDTPKQKWEQDHAYIESDPAPFDVDSNVAAAAVDQFPASPGGNYVFTAAKRIDITHDHYGRIDTYELLDSNDKITFPGTHENLDPIGLTSDGISTQLFTFGQSAPAAPDYLTDGLQAVSREIIRVNRVTSKAVDYFKVNKSDEQWIYDHIRKTTDPSNIKNLTILGAVFVRGSEPSAPGAASLVLNHKEYFELSSPNTSNKQGILWFYGETTSADDEIFQHTKLDTDPYDLTSSAVTGALVTTGAILGSPTAPTTPGSMVLSHWMDAPLTDASASNQSLRLYFWELRTSKDAIEEDGTHAKVDDIGIDSEGQATQVYTTLSGAPANAASPDASLKKVARLKQELNRVKSKAVDYFDVNDSEEKWLFARTKILADASALKNLTIKGAVFIRGAEPGAPGASGLVLNHTETFDITSPDTSDLQGILWFYSETTSADDEIFPKSKSETDPDGLESSAVTGAIFTTGSPPGDPSAPAAPTGLKLYRKVDQVLTNASASNKSIRLYLWEMTTSAERIERDGTKVETDPNKLQSTAQQTIVGTAAKTVADATITLPDDVELDATIPQQLNDGKWKTTLKWAINNSKNLWERLKKAVTTDVGHVAQEARVVKVLSSATPSADDTYNPDTTNLEFATAEVIPISATQFAHIYTFKPLSALNDKIEGFGKIVDDPVTALIGDDQRRIIDANATTAAPAVSGQFCIRRVTEKIGRTLYQHDYWYGFRSIGDQLEADKTWTEVDVSSLESEAMTADVWLVSGGAPGTPTLSGFVLRKRRDVEIQNPLYRLRLYSWGLTTPKQDHEYRGSRAIASVVDVHKIETATVETYSGSITTYADSILAANQSDATFIEAEVRRITPDYVEVVTRFDGTDKLIHSASNHAFEQQVRGVPSTSIVSGQYVPGNITVGDADAWVYVFFNFGDLRAKPLFIWRVTGRFLFRRIYDSTDITSYQYLAVRGQTNNATFLGYSAGEVMYLGPAATFTYAVSGGHRVVIDYEFSTDNWKHFGDGYLPEGRVAVNSGSILSTGIYSATQLEAGFVCDFPSQASFAGFIT